MTDIRVTINQNTGSRLAVQPAIAPASVRAVQGGGGSGGAFDPSPVYAHTNIVFGVANAAYGVANTANQEANLAYAAANASYGAVNSLTSVVQITFGVANTGNLYANLAFRAANAAFDFANTINIKVDSAYGVANVANARANLAQLASNAAYDFANNINIKTDAAFGVANNANLYANLAFRAANAAYDFANTINIKTDAAFGVANVANLRGNLAQMASNAAFDFANTINIKTDAAFAVANNANVYANLAFRAANAAYDFANTININVAATMLVANVANARANLAQMASNAAYDQANIANLMPVGNTMSNGYFVVRSTRHRLNFIPASANVRINVDDDSAGDRINVTIEAMGSGGGSGTGANLTAGNTLANGFYFTRTTALANINFVDDALTTWNVDTDATNFRINVHSVASRAPFDTANTANTYANLAFRAANAAFDLSNLKYDKTGGPVTGNVAIRQPRIFAANSALDLTADWANTSVNFILIKANIANASNAGGSARFMEFQSNTKPVLSFGTGAYQYFWNYTDASNYDRVFVGLSTDFIIQPEALGSGSYRRFYFKWFGADVVADGIFNIDASGSTASGSAIFQIILPATGNRKGFLIRNGSDSISWAAFEWPDTGLPRFGFGAGGASSRDTFLARQAAGIFEIDSGTAGDYRDLYLRDLVASRNVSANIVVGAWGAVLGGLNVVPAIVSAFGVANNANLYANLAFRAANAAFGVANAALPNTTVTLEGSLTTKGRLTVGVAGQGTSRLIFTGDGLTGGNNGTGFAFINGFNLVDNKQVWFGDPDYLGNSGAVFVRIVAGAGATYIDAVNGTNDTVKELRLDDAGLGGVRLSQRWLFQAASNFVPVTNNVVDIGDTTHRVRDIWAQGNVSSNILTSYWGAIVGGMNVVPAIVAAYNKANTTGVLSIANTLQANSYVASRSTGRSTLNFVPGTDIVVEITDDSSGDRTNIKIISTATSGVSAGFVYDATNAAFFTANTANQEANLAFMAANASYALLNTTVYVANLAFDKANAANVFANTVNNKLNFTTVALTVNSISGSASPTNPRAGDPFDKISTAFTWVENNVFGPVYLAITIGTCLVEEPNMLVPPQRVTGLRINGSGTTKTIWAYTNIDSNYTGIATFGTSLTNLSINNLILRANVSNNNYDFLTGVVGYLPYIAFQTVIFQNWGTGIWYPAQGTISCFQTSFQNDAKANGSQAIYGIDAQYGATIHYYDTATHKNVAVNNPTSTRYGTVFNLNRYSQIVFDDVQTTDNCDAFITGLDGKATYAGTSSGSKIFRHNFQAGGNAPQVPVYLARGDSRISLANAKIELSAPSNGSINVQNAGIVLARQFINVDFSQPINIETPIGLIRDNGYDVPATILYPQVNAALIAANTGNLYANLAFMAANAAFGVANLALPLTGGTMSGNINFNSTRGLTWSGFGFAVIAETGNLRVSGANLVQDSAGSTRLSPRILGTSPQFAPGEAARWQFGDAFNAIQNGYGAKMDIYAYHGIRISGARVDLANLAFSDGNSGLDYSLEVLANTTSPGALMLRGNLHFTDATFDIGKSDLTVRPRSIYLSENLVSGHVITGRSIVSGLNVVPAIISAFDTANTGNLYANLAFRAANAAFGVANSALQNTTVTLEGNLTLKTNLFATYVNVSQGFVSNGNVSFQATGVYTFNSQQSITQPVTPIGNQSFPKFQFAAIDSAGASIALSRFASNPTNKARLFISKGASDTFGTMTALTSDAHIGEILFSAADGTQFEQAASIVGAIDGSASSQSVPGRILFQTTPSGSRTPADRWIIRATGHLFPGLDNTYDIGETANNVRDVYVSRNVSAGTVLTGNVTLSGYNVHTRIAEANTISIGNTMSNGYFAVRSSDRTRINFVPASANLTINVIDDSAGDRINVVIETYGSGGGGGGMPDKNVTFGNVLANGYYVTRSSAYANVALIDEDLLTWKIDDDTAQFRINAAPVLSRAPFNTANTANARANLAQMASNAAYDFANTINSIARSAFSQANSPVFVSDSAPASPAANSLWWQSNTGGLYIYYSDGTSSQFVEVGAMGDGPAPTQEVLSFAAGDESSPLIAGTNKLTYWFAKAFVVQSAYGALSANSSSGNTHVDINKNGTSIFSSNITIMVANAHSRFGGSQPALTATTITFAQDDKMNVDIDLAGTNAAGLKVYLIGYYA